MNAPLRLRATGLTAAAGEAPGPIDTWLSRLVKLVPAEVVAVYLAGRPLAQREGRRPVAGHVPSCSRESCARGGRATAARPQWVSVRLGRLVRTVGIRHRRASSRTRWM